MATSLNALVPNLENVRMALAATLRERIIGDNAEEKSRTIMLAEGPRWFDEDRPIRRVHSDASMFIGGIRALLLQSLHPLAMAGVAQHSDFRSDPWGRLQRTADFLAITTFGTADMADNIIERIHAVHETVKGTTRDGIAYEANDPHLLRWVHVAEVDSFLTTYQTFAETPLSAKDADGYVEDMAVVARKMGIPAPPTSVKGLRDQLNSYRRELRSTPESRDAAKYLLIEPPLDAKGKVAYATLCAAAISTLPVWARKDLRLPWLPLTERLAFRPLGTAATKILRWATSAETDVVRYR
jgi:uncharacterized protein (DUF2236 family)